mmetsp:Transcript_1693/g.2359  ORF Transcript_1693/g.2359 Transcript_1693/m.2359 type:complete len:191 (+) Transcript_1693:280-852(+)|eukprot:CAMPEP_0113935268 /NCGR_PEP_ID=MMETSP1339-20121228/2435_1 /TAXON_ID=94617 /ORGANISM="Fibrocapsa japonica" /LENGTH=190 /DNA_ID=CAMNT_0000937345 /DNA_START=261 /DNA_END=833 /DNA_ORIENTATION=+ /assembly_acc=CAM_ASM_000762
MQLFGRLWEHLPKLIVFDVDYTLWPYWIDTHLSAPFCKGDDGSIRDSVGRPCILFPDVKNILLEIYQHPDIEIGLASRTGQPSWLKQLAELHLLDDGNAELTLWSVAKYREVYPGSKLKHFRKISQASGIHCSEMLFFDDEPYNNSEVCQLGVILQEVPSFSDTGTTIDIVLKGLEEFEKSKLSVKNSSS